MPDLDKAIASVTATFQNWYPWGALVAIVFMRTFKRQFGALVGKVTEIRWLGGGMKTLPQESAAPNKELAPSTTNAPLALPGATGDHAATDAAGQDAMVPAATPQNALTPAQRADVALAASFAAPYMLVDERGLQVHLEEIGVAADPAQAVRVLARYTIGWRERARWEHIYGGVYASQFHLLRQLNTGAMSLDAVKAFHAASTGASIDFEDWLRFLEVTASVVNRNGEQQTIVLNQRGRLFLAFLLREGRPDPFIL